MSFQALEIARTALFAHRVALEVASQNVANASTPGYVRQRVALAPVANADPGGSGLVGGGVEVITIQRLRDQCLEAQINHQEGRLGQEQARSGSLTRIQSYFPDLNQAGISKTLGALFDSFQRLQTMPESLTAREEVLFSAEALCQEMQLATGKLSAERELLETDLHLRVTQTNEALGRVADLNAKISSLGASTQANDLRVMREETIRELAGLCGATGLDQPDGSQDVLLGGIRLVQGAQTFPLTLVPDTVDPTRSQVAVGDLVQPAALAGSLAGDLQARDTNLAGWQQALGELAAGLADALNVRHRSGYDLSNRAGGDFLQYDPAHPARSLAVNAALIADPTQLAAASAVGGAPGDGSNAAALSALRTDKLLSGGTRTCEEFQAGLLYDIGVQTRNASDALTARQTFLGALDLQYANQAGVSLDEEAIEVMRHQQTYNAALKLIQIADEMISGVLGLVD